MRPNLRLKSNVYGLMPELHGRFFLNEPLSRHTTFNIGGPTSLPGLWMKKA